jgi:hypothetical protein
MVSWFSEVNSHLIIFYNLHFFLKTIEILLFLVVVLLKYELYWQSCDPFEGG